MGGFYTAFTLRPTSDQTLAIYHIFQLDGLVSPTLSLMDDVTFLVTS
jgi:hypothetical protein